eukprot:Gb_07645 [translate_table: standard]
MGSWVRTSVKLVVFLCTIDLLCASAVSRTRALGHPRKLCGLVEEKAVVLSYHNGPLLTVGPVHVIWYGKFSPLQRSIVGDFVQSLGANLVGKAKQPSVSTWWKTIQRYKDASTRPLPSAPINLGKQKLDESYSLGKTFKRSHIHTLLQHAFKSGALPENRNAVYLVLTSEDVSVEGFCMSSCGFHANMLPSTSNGNGNKLLVYAWVGNSARQCPGQCAWPFYQPIYGPQTTPLVAPNGDVGIDGMIINIATLLAGAVTNPFNTGYFQGNPAAPLEAVSACTGIYGKGAYPGYPGKLLLDPTTGASFNAHGVNGRRFLLPAMWDPASRTCKTTV